MTQHGNISKHASVCTYVDSLHSFFEMSHFKRSMPWSIIINLFPIYFLLYQVVESNLLKETTVEIAFSIWGYLQCRRYVQGPGNWFYLVFLSNVPI